jgi:ATP-binding cassette subfamily B protein|tara:strand:+ start:18131 stop:20140 length:2010 start_codon:yes stop_codon:yes gene_type:complete
MSEQTYATPVPQSSPPKRDYSAFDADLTGQAFNFQLFARLLRWLRQYRLTVAASLLFVLMASWLTVMLPLITGRVAIDTILRPNPKSGEQPDFGMTDLTYWISDLGDFGPLIGACILYLAMVTAQAGIMYLHRITLASSVLRSLRDLRVDLFSTLEDKPSSFYDRVAVGRVMTRVTNDIENLNELLTGFGMLVGEFVPFFVALYVMAVISPSLTLIVLVAIPIAAVATYFFRMAMRDIFRLIRNSVSALNQYLQENLIGIQVVQLSGREAMNEEMYGRLNHDNRRFEFKAINYETLYHSFNESLASIAIGAIIWFGGGQVVQDEITLGDMIIFTQYITMMIMPIVGLGEQFNVLYRAMASGERIFQAIDWDERLKEPEHPVVLPPRLRGEIELRNVHFGYNVDEPVLKDVSFNIEPGEKLAIVGPTGSGKSTIIRLLARFYDFDDDMIFLDGIDLNQIRSRDLRQRIGVVLQDFHIFSGTVRENIMLNNPNISAEQAEQAARTVNADGFIRQLPDGYDTHLAERGQNLSQGQRQLLAFARVLAADPEILVLDEATASIDTATELVIQDALHKLTEGRSSIIIAHRLQTIQECDRILVLHHGIVREFGTHDELIAKRGIYYTLHELQFQDGEVAAELAGADTEHADTTETQQPDQGDDGIPGPMREPDSF